MFCQKKVKRDGMNLQMKNESDDEKIAAMAAESVRQGAPNEVRRNTWRTLECTARRVPNQARPLRFKKNQKASASKNNSPLMASASNLP